MLPVDIEGMISCHVTIVLTTQSLCAVQELITFDVNENGTPLLGANNFGLRVSFFGLKFGDGFGTVQNNGGTFQQPTRHYTIMAQSLPNVAVWSPDSYATIQPAAGVIAFALNSIYVGYLQGSGAPNTAGPVTITGSLQSVPVQACSYTVTPVEGQPPTFVATVGCVNVDQIQIGDTQGQYWYIDSMTVTIFKLANA